MWLSSYMLFCLVALTNPFYSFCWIILFLGIYFSRGPAAGYWHVDLNIMLLFLIFSKKILRDLYLAIIFLICHIGTELHGWSSWRASADWVEGGRQSCLYDRLSWSSLLRIFAPVICLLQFFFWLNPILMST